MNEQKLKKKLVFMLTTVILLVCGLAITSFALATSIVSIRENKFYMSAGIEFQINDGLPVVGISDIVYEPGGTYKSEFPIANDAPFDVWYRVYFTDVDGVLKDYIIVTIKEDNGMVLCQGVMSDLEKNRVNVGSLRAGEEKKLYLEFYFSSEAGNSLQGKSVTFNITADATQKQNNLNKDFGD